MKVTFGIMGVQTLKIQNKAKRSGESACFIFLRGATHIESEVSEQALHEGKLEVETSLGTISIAIDRGSGSIGCAKPNFNTSTFITADVAPSAVPF